METEIIHPLEDERWEALVGQEGAGLYQSSRWMAVIRKTYDLEPAAALVCEGGGDPLGGLAVFPVDDPRGPRLISLPFSDHAGPVGGNADTTAILVEGLRRRFGGAPLFLRCLNPDPPWSRGFVSEKSDAWHRVTVLGDVQELFQSLSGSARRNIRRMRSLGVTVREGERGDLRRFFQLHLAVRKRKFRLLAQPFRFFENIWTEFIEAGRGFLLLAERGGEIAGGSMFLAFGDTLFYKFNATDYGKPENYCSYLLLWEGFLRARERNLQYCDLGTSPTDGPGLIQFKAYFARETGRVVCLRDGPAPAGEGEGRDFGKLLGTLTRILTEPGVPDGVTEAAGEVLYRYFA
ncbi:MAG: lipid II:glycine glycyltransferase FemX [Planctomycetota bacterium]|jgi:hypothetical protein